MKIKKILLTSLVILVIVNIQLSLATEDVNPIDNATACYSDAVNFATITLLFQGGRIKAPLGTNEINSVSFDMAGKSFEIYYGFDFGKKTFPSKKEIASELENYINELFLECLDYSGFEKKGYSLAYSFPETEVAINKDNIQTKTELNLEITDAQNNIQKLGSLDKTLNVRFGHIYDAANEIIDKHMINPANVNKNLISKYESLKLSILRDISGAENTVVYSITDAKSSIDNIPGVFMFAAKEFEGDKSEFPTTTLIVVLVVIILIIFLAVFLKKKK